MLIHHPYDIPHEKLFKSINTQKMQVSTSKDTREIHYCKTLIIKRGGPSETAFAYSFGAHGNGKAPYDGIGGTLKKYIV